MQDWHKYRCIAGQCNEVPLTLFTSQSAGQSKIPGLNSDTLSVSGNKISVFEEWYQISLRSFLKSQDGGWLKTDVALGTKQSTNVNRQGINYTPWIPEQFHEQVVEREAFEWAIRLTFGNVWFLVEQQSRVWIDEASLQCQLAPVKKISRRKNGRPTKCHSPQSS